MSRAYYVSVLRSPGSFALALGPYWAHDEALAQVERVRAFVQRRDPWAHFYGFGTASLPGENAPRGRLNDVLGTEAVSA